MSIFRGKDMEITLLPGAWDYWRPLDLTLEEMAKELFNYRAITFATPREQFLKKEILKRLETSYAEDSFLYFMHREELRRESLQRPGDRKIYNKASMGRNSKRKTKRGGGA